MRAYNFFEMPLIVNIFVAIVLFAIPLIVYKKGFREVPHPYLRDTRIRISPDLFFLTFSVATAMIFLNPISLVKYGYWIIVLIFLAFSRLKIKVEAIVGVYMVFLALCLFSEIFVTSTKFDGLMMLIKYALPLFYLWLAYTAIEDSTDLIFFLKVTAIAMCIYALVIGGFTEKYVSIIPKIVLGLLPAVFTKYAALADLYSSTIVVPAALYLITKNKIWIAAALWVALSTFADVVRTGIGGICLALSFFAFVVYKFKSVPWIAGFGLAAAVILFTVPAFRDKMFTEGNEISLSDFSTSDANFENIDSHMRSYVWELNMERFYEPSPVFGSGIGEAGAFTKTLPTIALMHSDYVQMLCEIGILGVVLFGVFVLTVLLKIITVTWRPRTPFYLKLCGAMALGSCAGTFFSMTYDNVVTYAQQSFVLPFVFIGIFLKVNDLYKQGLWK